MLNWVEINLKAIEHNIAKLKQKIGSAVKFGAVVKANAYGHGLVKVGQTAWNCGADYLMVASLDEALTLRGNRIQCPILVMGYVDIDKLKLAADYDVTLSLYNVSYARGASRYLARQNRSVKCHVKVDTGMNRMGEMEKEAVLLLRQAVTLSALKIEGIYSHLADASNSVYSQKQLVNFQNLLFQLQKEGIERPTLVHFANSAATLKLPTTYFDMVRCGIAIYGLAPDWQGQKAALSFKTKIMQVKQLSKDALVGYGSTYKTKKPTKIAILGVGYADGFARDLSNLGEVLIEGKRCQVIGRVCMNQTIVLVPDDIFPQSGDEAVLIGRQGKDELTVFEIAEKLDTIPHEIVARIPSSVPRVYK
ncbi:MAG: alanine racemase [Candidatus Nealsonbacteria bacterium CG23_combo_of_CG06-09_8_20_14_all_40_13]|uniref:Alanine racemase n=1 Tax=Candidatus Nealsonbacteria bacterium CG23_combo_of_CG06-09_8_20_14_all_40_13 TaxID=1974724 RepID=A0A2G9YRQ6_9BACT|nr:MAG: alanine racemase [Candidatus Nealsonbacteria bacterium CG23_combo_of_CG06-09_8_20_14_all_40_13]PIR71251.1 MAG: alanine racemase [Candidatus Nealsonbacteria bacterium CG10_big_fil_rev_8_21_14_0_10_40_24]PIU43276.1 MAG: alanine racemase [Candidatus Nealsonbacteria bacterium CG07_land_8_20_14_0_80_40_10]